MLVLGLPIRTDTLPGLFHPSFGPHHLLGKRWVYTQVVGLDLVALF